MELYNCLTTNSMFWIDSPKSDIAYSSKSHILENIFLYYDKHGLCSLFHIPHVTVAFTPCHWKWIQQIHNYCVSVLFNLFKREKLNDLFSVCSIYIFLSCVETNGLTAPVRIVLSTVAHRAQHTTVQCEKAGANIVNTMTHVHVYTHHTTEVI